MSANQVETTREGTPVHVRRAAPWLRRLAPWVAGAVLVAGIVMAIVHFVPSKNGSAPPSAAADASLPANAPPAPKTVALPKAATSVGRQFLKTAVARQDLAAAWKISSADVRGGLTHREWMSGNIPVVPYPVDAATSARFKIDYSYRNEAMIEVALIPAQGQKIKPQVFAMDLKRVPGPGGKRVWVVDSWVPKSATLVPLGTN